MLLYSLILFGGIDMIGACPNRTVPEPDPAGEPEVSAPEVPEVPSVEPIPDVPAAKPSSKKKSVKSQTKSSVVCEEPAEVPMDENIEDEPLVTNTSGPKVTDMYEYYVYSSNSCRSCKVLINNLKAHIPPDKLHVEHAAVTKSGKEVLWVPMLEVYYDDVLLFEHIGALSWNSILKGLDALK